MTSWRVGSLFRKYLLAFLAVVAVPLLAYGALASWQQFREHRATLAELQRLQAEAGAQRIAQFFDEIALQLAWATHLPLPAEGAEDAHRLDAARVLRQLPAVTDLVVADAVGQERVHLSRVSLNRSGRLGDRSADPAFTAARRYGVYYSPVEFRRDSEPYMRIAVAGRRRDDAVVIAEVNLKHVREVISGIRVQPKGLAWLTDRQRRLIAHPDMSLVLRNTRVPDALAGEGYVGRVTEGLQGGPVIASRVAITEPGWFLHVELPRREADAALHATLWRAGWITLLGLALALVVGVALSRRMVGPIRRLHAGAEVLGAGDLRHRIDIRTGDELQDLGAQFNAMAERLQASYERLEQKVAERTRQLAEANDAKSRFIAAASHDLRQPLHALHLLVAQWRGETDPEERVRLAGAVADALGHLDALFGGILDLTRLDAGAIAPNRTVLAVQPLLDRVAATWATPAADRGLRLRVVPSRAWVCSDPQWLARILHNLVSNALRYTRRGRVLVGARRRGGMLWLEVHDTGVGIPPAERERIFQEFYRVRAAGGSQGEGLGLGLSIVERLGNLLGHPVEVLSQPGRGSCFRVGVPLTPPVPDATPPGELEPDLPAPADKLAHHLVLVVDADARVREATAGLLDQWGCSVVAAAGLPQAMQALGSLEPELLVLDVADGVDAALADVQALRHRCSREVPAVLVSGDVTIQLVARNGIVLLHKPVAPMSLRAACSRLLDTALTPEEAAATPTA